MSVNILINLLGLQIDTVTKCLL